MTTKIAGVFMVVIGGVILADILIHPAGTTAAGNALVGVLTPSYDALLGTAPKSS